MLALETPQRLCVVCPCYNEQDVVAIFYRVLKTALEQLRPLNVTHRILFVDDGSTDATLEELNRIAKQDECVEVYSLSRNFGQQVALTAGLDAAEGDMVLMMDSDLQHPPGLIPVLVQKYLEGVDVVSTIRIESEDKGPVKRWMSSAFYRLINLFSDTPLVANAPDFCLLSQRAHHALVGMPERHRYMKGMVSWIGFPREFVAFKAPRRAAGNTKYTFRQLVRLALDAAYSLSAVPVRMVTQFGLLLLISGFVCLSVLVVRGVLPNQTIEAWKVIAAILATLSGCQIALTGVLAEYVVRTFNESRRRPLYFLKQQPSTRDVRNLKVYEREAA